MCISEGGIVKKQINKTKKDYKLNLISQDIKLAFISFFPQTLKRAPKS